MAELTITPQHIDDMPNSTIVFINGIVDVTTEKKLKYSIDVIVKSGLYNVILNLKDLKFLNSSGFAYFVILSDKLKLIDGSLIMYNVPAPILDMAQFLGLTEFFIIENTQEDALLKLADIIQ
ncbi:MAG: STAS domain-containing protein [Candidatus Heimdallarchaeota archaeon]|nr:STAS domain-containing protein [Candidatus Heimdallarchaeota archaeon]